VVGVVAAAVGGLSGVVLCLRVHVLTSRVARHSGNRGARGRRPWGRWRRAPANSGYVVVGGRMRPPLASPASDQDGRTPEDVVPSAVTGGEPATPGGRQRCRPADPARDVHRAPNRL